MAATVVRARPKKVTLALTLTLIDGFDVNGHVMWITAPATEDVYVVSDGASADTDALGAKDYMRIPAGTMYPFEIRSDPILLAGSVGGGVATVRVV